jgi:SAM-dependent methyltransferase
MILNRLALLRHCKHPVIIDSSKKGACSVCGHIGEYLFQEVINDDLANAWKINRRQRRDFDNRESLKCQNCGASLRIRNLARAIMDIEGEGLGSIKELSQVKSFKNKRIAEINNCGSIHDYLKLLPGLSYSEYNPSYRSAVRHEDLLGLTYEDSSFDLVLTSDTLEHIPSTDKALKEIGRILKPGGYHIFTVPMLPERKFTKRRIEVLNNKMNFIEPKSYHGQTTDDYLVFYEFGRDLLDIVRRQGFRVMLYYYNIMHDKHAFVFVTRRI